MKPLALLLTVILTGCQGLERVDGQRIPGNPALTQRADTPVIHQARATSLVAPG